MEWRSTSIYDDSFTLYSNKEQMARVLRCFHVVADEFPEYVLVGAGMSTSWRLCGMMQEFYVVSRASAIQDFEQRPAAVEPSRSASIDPVSAVIGFGSSRNKYVEEEVVEDIK
ncbi:unnamed protein product [Lactuca virosa]|uniref:Uncharacterized protein n=1 Tax=Lactuca virosa TaxID=75947 RepID=A0AAU9N9X6_9ASTR|nr:unnamed protein product [Lactuca virosa]